MAQIPVIAFDDDNQFAGFDLAAEFAPVKKMSEPVLRGKAFEMAAFRMSVESLPNHMLALLVEDSYDKLANATDPDRDYMAAKNAAVAKVRKQELDALASVVGGATDIMPTQEIIDNALQNVQLLNQVYEGRVGTENLVNDNISPSGVTTDDVKGFASTRLMEEFGDRDLVDKFIDGAALLVPDMFFDASQLAGKFGGMTALAKEIALFQRLPPGIQMQFMDQRIPQIIDAFDNNQFKAAMIVQLYTDPEFYSTMLLHGTLEATAAADVGLLTKGVVAATLRSTRASGRLKAAGDSSAAAQASAAVGARATSKDAALDSAMEASPFNFEGVMIDQGVVDGISVDGQKILNKVQLAAKARRQQLETIEFQRITPLTEKEREVAQQTAVDSFNEILGDLVDDVSTEAGLYSRAELVESTDNAFKIKYTVNGQEMEHVIQYTQDAVGNLVAWNPSFLTDTLKSWGTRIFSQDVLLRHIDDTIVPNVTAGGNQGAIVRNGLTRVAKKLDQGLSLSKNDRHEVNALLLAGDERGKVYSADELLAGMVEINGTKKPFTPDQIESYYNHVNFFKELGAVRNNMVRKQLQFENYQAMRYANPKTKRIETTLARPVIADDPNVVQALERSPVIYAPQANNGGGKMVKVTTILDKDGNVKPGWKLMELREPMFLRQADESLKNPRNQVRFAAYRETKAGTINVGPLPNTVVRFSPGYVPRIRKPGYFWVKSTHGTRLRTISAFDKKKEAEAYAATLRAKAQARGQDKHYEVFEDRERLSGDQWRDNLELSGGSLFTGSRARHRILINGKKEYVPQDTRLNVADSTQMYIENISSVLPLNEYRSALIKRFMNSANVLAKLENKVSAFEHAGDFRSAIQLQNKAARQNLENLREYLVAHMGIQSNQEKAFGKAMTMLATQMEREGLQNWKIPFKDNIRNGFLWLSAKDPTGMLKGATFSAHLGWFNMRQLYIQAQNANLAVTAYPQHAPQIVNALLMRPTIYLLYNTGWKGAASMVAKAMGRNMDEYIHELDLFRKSGLFDSITRLADYQAAVQSLTPGTFSMMQKLSRTGQIFFNEGEIMARLISFQIAKKEYMNRTGKAIMNLTGKDAVEISKETLRIMMNLQKENSAWWQNAPVLGNITQFQQVHTKLIERIVGGLIQDGAKLGKGANQATKFGGTQWSRGEAMRATLGQFLFYGTVGVPVAEEAVSYIEAVTGLAREDIPEEVIVAVEEGIVGWYAEAVGINNNLSEPANILSGLDDIVLVKFVKSMFDGEKLNFWKTFGGPGINLIDRGGDVVSNLIMRGNVLFRYPSVQAAEDLLLGAADDIASITSTWNNAKKALHLRAMTTPADLSMRLQLENTNMYNIQTVLAKGMGFETDLETARWQLQADTNKQIANDRRATTDSMKTAFATYSVTDNHDNFVATMAFLLEPYSPTEQSEIMERFLEQTFSGKTDLDRQVSTFLRSYLTSSGRIEIPSALERVLRSEQE